MPILKEELSIYPDDLLDEFTLRLQDAEGPQNGDGELRWWAIHAKSRQEKALARELLAQEIPFYLPLVPKRQFIGRRSYCSHLPLFPGYVFVFGTERSRLAAFNTNRVAKMMAVWEPEQLLTDLRRIRQLIAADVPLTVERRMKPGDQVRIRRGLLAGIEGTILRRNGRTRLLIAVKYLQQGVSVEIDDFMVEPM